MGDFRVTRIDKIIAALAVTIATTAAASAATYTQVDFSSQMNQTFTGFSSTLSTVPSGNDVTGNAGTGVPFDIPTTGNQMWSAYTANTGSGTVSLTIDVGIYGVDSVYTLINTSWGITTITFEGSGGASQTIDLVGGEWIRDYNNYIWTNTITSPNATNWWNNGETASNVGKRIDMQTFNLDSAFLTQTLDRIILTDKGNTNVSRSFIAGVTVETVGAVPLPAGGLLLIGGLGALGVLKRRKRA